MNAVAPDMIPTPGDAGLMAEHGVRVAHCPHSNARLECGDAPIELFEVLGIPVGLGTDSPASAGAYDLRDEARWAAEGRAREERLRGGGIPRQVDLRTALQYAPEMVTKPSWVLDFLRGGLDLGFFFSHVR